MKNVFIYLVLASSLFAEFSGSLQLTGTNHYSKPTEHSFHVNDRRARAVATLDYENQYENIYTNIRVSNKLYDTYWEQIRIGYSERIGNHIFNINLGTVDTYQGVFSESYLATEQSPFIFKNHGMYNDEFLAGWLDTTLGSQVGYQYLCAGKYLYTVSYTFSKARELSKDRAEGAFYGYQSDYADLDYSSWIRSVDVKFEYKNTFTLFGNIVEMDMGVKPTSSTPASYQGRVAEYLSNGRDGSVFVPNTPFEILVQRAGAIYENTKLQVSYEAFRMFLSNKDLNVNYTTYGYSSYLAYYFNMDTTGYISYGRSHNTKSTRAYTDKIIGVRYNIKDNVTILAEVKESSWIQHKTFKQHKAYLAQDDRDIISSAIQLIIGF